MPIWAEFFREVVLSAYASKCCISQISERWLLEACHIVSWAEDAQNRLNPKNGLCLNLFFHGAYDAHLLGISPDYRVEVSERLLASAGSDSFRTYLRGFQGKEIILPEHFSPSQDLLARQYDKFLQPSEQKYIEVCDENPSADLLLSVQDPKHGDGY